MEAQALKEQENELLIIQTQALKIDESQEQEHSLKHTMEEAQPNKEQVEETSNIDSPPPPLPLDEVETIIGYEFKDKHLLEEAFTDSTYDVENNLSFERLEYIGDAVLNLLITKEQFFSYPNLKPGELTPLRSKNVDTEKLARVAIKLGLQHYLRHKKPMLDQQIETFTKAVGEYPVHSNGQMYVPKTLADIVESTIGAIYIDCGSSHDIVWKVFRELLEPIIEPEAVKKHPLTELNEVCQKKKLNLQFVDSWKESMSIDVFINDKFVARGTFGSKKGVARYIAAKNALENLGKVLSIN